MPTVSPSTCALDIVRTPPGAPRMARLVYRSPLDIEDTVVFIPAALVKGVAAKLCAGEAEGELKRLQSGQGQRREADSNGIIVPR